MDIDVAGLTGYRKGLRCAGLTTHSTHMKGLNMRVTVCELPEDREKFNHAWQHLTQHVAAERSDFVLLPAAPFSPWLARTRSLTTQVWIDALRAHDEWEPRLHELAPAIVASTRPMDFGNERYEQAFLWDEALGFRGVHAKSVLRDSPGYREATWYTEAVPDFVPLELQGLDVGFLLDAELSQLEQAEHYGRQGVRLLLAPRCTESDSCWLEAGRRAAALAHAHLLSSN